MTQCAGKKVVGLGWLSPAMVAEEGGVPKDIPAASHMHGVPKVPQRWADHVWCQLRLQPPLAMGARHPAEHWQLPQAHLDPPCSTPSKEPKTSFQQRDGLSHPHHQEVRIVLP